MKDPGWDEIKTYEDFERASGAAKTVMVAVSFDKLKAVAEIAGIAVELYRLDKAFDSTGEMKHLVEYDAAMEMLMDAASRLDADFRNIP